MKKRNSLFIYALLHGLLMCYSISGILTKIASQQLFLSLNFCLCYAGIIAILGIYAIGWQQIIKRMPLTTAYANKSVTIVWGIIWGEAFFGESITVEKIIGAVLVIAGVVLFAVSDGEPEELIHE